MKSREAGHIRKAENRPREACDPHPLHPRDDTPPDSCRCRPSNTARDRCCRFCTSAHRIAGVV